MNERKYACVLRAKSNGNVTEMLRRDAFQPPPSSFVNGFINGFLSGGVGVERLCVRCEGRRAFGGY